MLKNHALFCILLQWFEKQWVSAYDVEQAEQLNATKQALRKTLLNYMNSARQDLLTREAVVKV